MTSKPPEDYGNLLLTVPFYVYEELAWEDATFGAETVENLARTPRGRSKHADDFYFMKASLNHPMRTRDPSQAKIFVIPLLLNFYADRHYYSGREHKLCSASTSTSLTRTSRRTYCDRDLLRHAATVLQHSEWFQAHPERHIVVQSHYLADKKFKIPTELKDMLYQVNVISFENQVPNRPDRLRFPKYYVGHSCLTTRNNIDKKKNDPRQEDSTAAAAAAVKKTQDVVMIASVNHEKLHYFQDRLNVCEWIRNNNNYNNTDTDTDHNNATTTIIMSQCGQGEQCPALAQAKFGFHTRGDTLGSNRLMDTILSGTVPIFTRREQYDILPAWIDWKNQLSVLLPMNNSDDEPAAIKSNQTAASSSFLQALKAILQDEQGYQERQAAILQHRALFDWTTLYPFDTYMYMLQAELYPETRHPIDKISSVWPALLLPPPPPPPRPK